MSLRAFVALVAVALLGVTAITGTYVWVVVGIALYVVWMCVRIPIERSQRRAKLPGFTDIKPWRNQ